MQSSIWKVKKEDEFGRGWVKVWLYRETGSVIEVAHFGNSGEITTEEIEPGKADVAPTMILPAMGWDSLIESFKNEQVTYHEKEIDAELKATKYHLEDMRNLVFHKQPEQTQVSIGTNNGTINR